MKLFNDTLPIQPKQADPNAFKHTLTIIAVKWALLQNNPSPVIKKGNEKLNCIETLSRNAL
jgi:hypothetical protein